VSKQNKATVTQRGWFFTAMVALITGLCFYSGYALAADYQNIGQIATNVTGTFYGIAQLITAGSYIAGMGFALAAIMKFKQHKDNPTNIPIGTPIALLFISAALIFLPTIFGVAGTTIFGTSGGSVGGVTGVSTF
jgi:intracellular multiplication protein IcmD